MADNTTNTVRFDCFCYDPRIKEIVKYTVVFTTSIIICIGLPLTLLAIYTLCSLMQNNRVAPIYIINILIADVIQHCCMLQEVGFLRVEENAVRRFIHVYIYSLMVRVGFMLCLSADRFMVVTVPSKYSSMSSIKISLVVCAIVWCLPLVFLVPFVVKVDVHVTESIFSVFFFLPFPLLIIFFGGAVRDRSASLSVPSDEKRQGVGILVLVLLIYSLLFLPAIIWFIADNERTKDILSYKTFVYRLGVGIKDLSVLFIRFGPLADFLLCVFLGKKVIENLMAFFHAKRRAMMSVFRWRK